MKNLTGNEIRERFLSFFESKGHARVESSSLVPYDDPTLLFANAGMNQFKSLFLGLEKRAYTRATTSQKCVRAGGKHNDLDDVGRDARHFTFFEMLGNFSFGDYFKEDAIKYAWEFLTVEMGLPEDKLYASVYTDDDEAESLWLKHSSLPKERIIRLGAKDNFWEMGDTGPCGPCSEIMIDRGESLACGPDCGIGVCDCDRFLEIWNLVFMQYNRDAAGNMTPLPKPSIDTGMGLERITSVVQDVPSNYDTDIMINIIKSVEEITGKVYYKAIDDPRGFPTRVIADHIRSCVFLICDGVLPGNEGRGYVLRRIMRRAIRFGRALGVSEPFMYKLVNSVVTEMGGAYPDLISKKTSIERAILLEEERFGETLDAGIRMAREIIEKAKAEGQKELDGNQVFKLYDTFGFPYDLSADIAEEAGFRIDKAGFDAAMDAQRERSKAARKEAGAPEKALMINKLCQGAPTEFSGYETLEDKAFPQAMIREDELVDVINEGEEALLIFPRTPFYAESGGQVADRGLIAGKDGSVEIDTVYKLPDGRIVHEGRARGQVRINESLSLWVDKDRRRDIMGNHTGTHLLHKALREVLGSHVSQAGSLVEPQRLRFDFTHFSALTDEEIRLIESKVNQAISAAYPVSTTLMDPRDAVAEGAIALFGEKYGDIARVVTIGDYSMELCGGTHMDNTSGIGLFKIVSESAISAGARRIEAVTGTGVLTLLEDKEEVIRSVAEILKAPANAIETRLRNMVESIKTLEKALEKAEAKIASMQSEGISDRAIDISGARVLIAKVEARDKESFLSLSDSYRDRLGSGIVALGAVIDNKTSFVVTVSKDYIQKGYKAGNIIKRIAEVAGGSGGGRPDMAFAGGKDPALLDAALESVKNIVSDVAKMMNN